MRGLTLTVFVAMIAVLAVMVALPPAPAPSYDREQVEEVSCIFARGRARRQERRQMRQESRAFRVGFGC